MENHTKKLNEIKDRVYGRTVGIYDDVCRKHDLDWLISRVDTQQNQIEDLTSDIDGYTGTIDAITEEFTFVTGRLQNLKQKMLESNPSNL